jgi:SAM-dependent methyltransferase
MQTADELKHIFQEGWNIPARVDNYVCNVAEREFAEGECLTAWRHCLTSALSTTEKVKILDVGTGPGIYACLYSQMGHECIGLDFSQRMLAEAHRRAARIAPNCSFVFADAEKPPFANDKFDVVSSRHLLFNLPRPGVAVREWVRILKPGGKLILIGDEHVEHPARTLQIHLHRKLGKYRGRSPDKSKPGWRPSADYLKAVSQCPLFKQGKGPIIAVMQAAGLQDIRSCSTEAIYAARLKNHFSAKRSDFTPGQPYILVGVKPPTSPRPF